MALFLYMKAISARSGSKPFFGPRLFFSFCGFLIDLGLFNPFVNSLFRSIYYGFQRLLKFSKVICKEGHAGNIFDIAFLSFHIMQFQNMCSEFNSNFFRYFSYLVQLCLLCYVRAFNCEGFPKSKTVTEYIARPRAVLPVKWILHFLLFFSVVCCLL